jgi:ribonucleoside-diphosphate reductase alpha chain
MTGEDAAALGGAGLFVPGTWAQVQAECEAWAAAQIADLTDDDALAGLSPGARLASEIVRLRTYAKVKPDGQRETWRETVTRWGGYFRYRLGQRTGSVAAVEEMARAVRAVFQRAVMPSMRSLWAAGEVIEANDIALYNCAFAPADSIAVFWESLYILMHGTGFGFSVEREFVDRLPVPNRPADLPADEVPIHVVKDSTEGWRNAVEVGARAWFGGDDVWFDFSEVRPAGSKLKTKGGEASGPEPLMEYLTALRTIIRKAGRECRKIATIEAHDLKCTGAGAVQVGGVRRSAEISFSDRDDKHMRWAKHYPAADALGAVIPMVRTQANNSWVWPDKPLPKADFDYEWQVMATSNSGERGIFAPQRLEKKRGRRLRANPCVEIGLSWQDYAPAVYDDDGALVSAEVEGGGQFCNLSNVILRPGDTLESALVKTEIAAFIGTLQASCTNFRGLRSGWTEVTRRDALLGVGLSGQADCPAVATSTHKLACMSQAAISANERWAAVLGINAAAGVTCGKPDGNSSVFLGCSSGVHAHHAPHYLRRITVAAKSPICAVLREAGLACIPGLPGQAEAIAAGTMKVEDVNAWLFELPMAAPAGALVRADEGAIELLDRVDRINDGWLGEKGHNQSVTVNVKPHEWDAVRDRVYERGCEGRLGGVSFSPDQGLVYYGTPLTDLDRDEYEARTAALPVVDWIRLAEFENGVSEGAQTFACAGGACSIV